MARSNKYDGRCRNRRCPEPGQSVEAGAGVLVKGRLKDDGSGKCWWDTYHQECVPEVVDWEAFGASDHQLGMRQAWSTTTSHLIVRAVAGSGKTTSIIWLLATTWIEFSLQLRRPPRAVFSCFNKAIRDELSERVPAGTAEVVTLNGMGHRVVSRFLRSAGLERIDVDSKKPWRHIRRLFPRTDHQLRVALGGSRPGRTDLEGWLQVLARLDNLPGGDEDWRDDLDRGSAKSVVTTCRALLKRNAALHAPLKELVSLRRATLSDDFEGLISIYSIRGTEGNEALIEAAVPMVVTSMEEEAYKSGVIDYDEQLWLPHSWDLHPEAMDLVTVDEAQDVNEAQFELIQKAAKTGRLIMVGDSNQAIYGFRGAGAGMLGRIEQALSETDRAVISVPLSVCYRCPLVVLELVRRRGHVTHIEAAPGAPRGRLLALDDDGWWKGADAAALVLCRTNAPLMCAYFRLLVDGVKASIRGRGDGGIYDDLSDMIDRHAPESGDLAIMIGSAVAFEEQEAPKLIAAEKDRQLARLRDLTEVLIILSGEMRDVDHLRRRIDAIFVGDDESNPGIVLSTVHKAKGLEADEVYILEPQLIPWPYARGWEVEQEKNLEYVAYTRAKKALVFVGAAPDEAYASRGTGLVDGCLVDEAPAKEQSAVRPQLRPSAIPAEPELDPVDLSSLDLSSLPTWPGRGDGSYDPPRSMGDWQKVVDAYEAAGVPTSTFCPRGWGSKVAISFAGRVRVSACLHKTTTGYAPVEKGENAIDVVPTASWKGRPSGPTRRVLRKNGWEGRAAARINSALRDEQRRDAND